MLHDLLFLVHIHVQGSGMTVSAVCYQTLCLIQRLVKCLCLVHSQYRRQLLMSKLLADIHGLNLTDEDLGIFRYLHSCQLGNGCCLLSNDLGIEGAVYKNGLADLLDLTRL